MRKRLSSKLLAVILTIAICATTVLGCLMSVSAQASCYSFGTAQFAEDDLTEASIDVTFTANDKLPNGFSAGAFSVIEVDADAEDYLILKDVKPVTDGINIANEGNYYLFDGEVNTSVKFTLTFGFSKGEANEGGKEYKIKLTDVELAYGDGAYFAQDDSNGAVGTISAACKHVIGVVGEPLVTNEPNNYSVYEKSVCTLCGEEFGYQLVPTAESLNDVDVNLPTEEDKFEGNVELRIKYDQAGDSSKDMNDSSNWVLKVNGDGAPHQTWGYIDADIKLLDETKENSEENPYIIETAEQLFYLVKIAGNVTAGKYYKVKDGIRAFHLSPNVTDETSFDDMLANIGTGGAYWDVDANAAFQGHFDGNGIIITGLKTRDNATYAGLFPQIEGNVTIKNVTIMNSKIVGTGRVGGFIGQQKYSSAKGEVYDIVVENCAIYQCYMQSTNTSYGVGAIAGHISNTCNPGTGWINGDTVINNCYVNLDEDYFISTTETSGTGTHGGAVGYQGSAVMNVTNSIFIGIRPYTARNLTGDKWTGNQGWQGAKASCYNNVYTTHACDDGYNNASTIGAAKQDFTGRVTQVTSLKGFAAVAAMPTLDWGNTWVMDGDDTYPRLAKPDEKFDAVYWDGTTVAPTQDENGTYIIDSAEKLAYIAKNGGTGNYKVADGIDAFVMQPMSVAPLYTLSKLSGYAETKAYFDGLVSAGKDVKPWYGYQYSSGVAFSGTFDGNGATVYGIYIKGLYSYTGTETGTTNGNSWSHASGLLPVVKQGTTIKNIAVKSSHIIAGGRVGAIAGCAVTDNDGFVIFENCQVANNFVASTNKDNNSNPGVGYAGVVFGDVQESKDTRMPQGVSKYYYVGIKMTNCLVYGNRAENYHNHSVEGVLNTAGGYNGRPTSSDEKTTTDGTTIYGKEYPNYTLTNSIVLDVLPHPSSNNNHCKNADSFEKAYTNDSTTAHEGKLFVITTSQALGSAAQTAMPNLTWGKDWYCGAEGEYPIQKSFATFGTSSVATPSLQLVGTNITYNDDGSLDFNIHFVPEVVGLNPTLYVGTLDGSKFMKLNAVASSQTATLGDNALMYVIPNLSARDIELVWLPTLVYAGSTVVQWGQSEQIALADNARAIIAGDYAQADKNVAAALLNYGNASGVALDSTYDYDAGTIDLLEFGDYLVEAGSTSPYWDTNVADNGETGADWANAIIIDSAEELVYLCKASGNETAGKYYKVADGIKGFNLSGNANLDIDGSLAKNFNIIKNGGKNHAGNTPGFQGHFDGNGATVYGAWTNHTEGNVSTYAGLISCTFGEVTIKNIHVNKAHFTAKNAAGGIIGYHKADAMCTVTIENCSVTDSYLEAQGTGYGCGVGAIIGFGASAPSYTENGATVYVNVAYNIKNCYVNLDEANFVSKGEDGVEDKGSDPNSINDDERTCHGGVMGVSGSNALKVSECVVIGITPYATMEGTSVNDVQHSGLETHFANVYTDAPTGKIAIGGSSLGQRDFTGKVFQLTLEQMTGDAAKANMPSLDWNNVWTTTSGYPTFINKDYRATTGKTIYWDGKRTEPASTASGDSLENAIIINTPAELAYIANAGYKATNGKYYKIADGIDKFVLQSSDHSEILALSSSDEVRDYFSDTKKSFTNWLGVSGYQSVTTADASEDAFAGYFDGNGVEIYGLYNTENNKYQGVFGEVDGNVTIENLTVKNAYMVASGTNFGGAAIVGWTQNDGDLAVNTLVFKNCKVANCYFRTDHTAANHKQWGILAGSLTNQLIMVEDCIVYGNDAIFTHTTSNTSTYYTLLGDAYNGMEVSDYDGEYYSNYNIVDTKFVANTITNTISIGTYPYRYHTFANRMCQPGCFENVYTDMPSGTSVTVGTSTVDYSAVITQITDLNTLKGSNAADIVASLNGDADPVWYAGATGDYPGFKPAGTMPSATQALYDGMVLTNADDYGDSVTSFGVYATGLNLKVNPYMTFTFVFGYEYAKEDIQVTFKSGDTVIETVTAADMTNNEGAGRYHLYRLKSAPVTALSTGITVSVTYGGVTTDFGTYSAEGFAIMADNASKVEPCDYYANLYEASKALLFYADMLAARYGA